MTNSKKRRVKMAPEDEIELITEIAQLRYEHGMTQVEIAREKKLSRSKVHRLINKAFELGIAIVHLEIPQVPRLQRKLIQKYNLIDALVVPSGTDTKRNLGKAAAQFLERRIVSGAKIGLAGGWTLYHAVTNIERTLPVEELTLYALSQDWSLENAHVYSNTLIGILATKYMNGSNSIVVKGMHSKESVFRPTGEGEKDSKLEAQISQELDAVFKEAQGVDIAVVGIGLLGEGTPGFSSGAMLHRVSFDDLERIGVVGEANSQPIFGEERQENEHNLQEYRKRVGIRALGLDSLQRLCEQGKQVIAVAGGKDKVEVIRAALRKRFFNILVTDINVARSITGLG